jgi:hypothetical protein
MLSAPFSRMIRRHAAMLAMLGLLLQGAMVWHMPLLENGLCLADGHQAPAPNTPDHGQDCGCVLCQVAWPAIPSVAPVPLPPAARPVPVRLEAPVFEPPAAAPRRTHPARGPPRFS